MISDKLRKATLVVREEIEKETQEIRFENRLNFNKSGVDQKILHMWEGKIKAHVEMCYDKILCHHWSLLGHKKTGAFVRACSAILGRHINQLGNTEAHKAQRAHRLQGRVSQSLEESYKRSAASVRKQLEEVWDIEARELELAASIVRRQENATSASVEAQNSQLRVGEFSRSPVSYSDNERLGERMGEWDKELRRISTAARAKRQYNEESARMAFPDFTLWKALDDSNLTALRRCELFGQRCQNVGSQDGRFQLIGELTGISPFTAYDIYKRRPSRKKRRQKK